MKIVIKAFGSIFYVLHCSFYNDALLIREMDIMRQPQKLASLWIPSTSIRGNWMDVDHESQLDLR
jgi:hypothetical protein